MSLTEVVAVGNGVVIAIDQCITRLGQAVVVFVHCVVVAFAQIHAVRHTIAVTVYKCITGVDDAVVVFVNRVIAQTTTVVGIGNAVVIAVVNTTIAVFVPTPCLFFGARIVPVLNVIHTEHCSVGECWMVNRVVCRFENGVCRRSCSVPFGEWFALDIAAIGSNGTDVFPNDITVSVYLVQRSLGSVGDQNVAVRQSLCTGDCTGIHGFTLVPRP